MAVSPCLLWSIQCLHGISWKPSLSDLPVVFWIFGPKSMFWIGFLRFWTNLVSWGGRGQRKHTVATRRIWWSMPEVRNVDPGSRIPDLGSRIWNPGSWIGIPDLGSGIPYLESRIRDPRSGIRDPGSRIQDPGKRSFDEVSTKFRRSYEEVSTKLRRSYDEVTTKLGVLLRSSYEDRGPSYEVPTKIGVSKGQNRLPVVAI